ncbi:ATP-binding protein [Cryobacterium sp. Sr8]|uniref:ATP-binding protein n=1 Tax=Cryobacterium sp. Sr8 TaxID=1259203 RepID=UPI00141B8FF2|nr:ATP-binding protein [Cryobacterium sp. Sr8]
MPVVFGEFGVGKTTLVLRYFQDVKEDGRLVFISSAEALTMARVFEVCLDHLNYSVEVESSSAQSVDANAGVNFGFVKAEAGGTLTDERRRRLVISSPTDTAVISVLSEAKLVLVIDEMHRATDSFRTELVNFIKATRAGAEGFNLVLIGTSLDAKLLVASDEGINRYIQETRVSVMTADEARTIVDQGFEKLKLRIADELADRLVRASVGAPTIVQELCLDSAESALEESRDEVLESDISKAVSRYLDQHEARMSSRYYSAIETQGQKRYRKRILHAMATLESDYATMEDIRDAVSVALGESVPSTALSGPLRDLKEEDYGRILQGVDRVISGEVIQNLSTFTDPMMKSFVRFMGNLDTTGLGTPGAR